MVQPDNLKKNSDCRAKMSHTGPHGFHSQLPMLLPTRNSSETLPTKKTTANIGPLRLAPFDKLKATNAEQEDADDIKTENDIEEIIVVQSDLNGKINTSSTRITRKVLFWPKVAKKCQIDLKKISF